MFDCPLEAFQHGLYNFCIAGIYKTPLFVFSSHKTIHCKPWIKSKLALLLGHHFTPLVGPLAAISHFPTFFEHLWPLLMRSSLPTWLPREPSYFSGLEPGSPLEVRTFFKCLLATTAAVQPPLPAREPSDLNGLNLGNCPWFVFGHCSHSPVSLPDYHETHLTRVDSILIVPEGFDTNYPSSSPWAFIMTDLAGFIFRIN